MHRTRFDGLYSFIRKRHRWIVIAWVVVVLVSLTLIPSFFSSVSYNIASGFGGPTNTESEKAQAILNAQFPSSSNGSDNSIILVIQSSNIHSYALQKAIIDLNSTFSAVKHRLNFTGMDSVYSTEYSVLNSSLPSLIPQITALQSNITTLDTALHSLEENISSLSLNVFQLEDGINQTSQLVFGIPTSFIRIWEGVVAQGVTDPYIANNQANATIFQLTSAFGGNAESLGYYSLFFNAWNSTFQTLPNSTTPLQRETTSVSQAVTTLLSNPQTSAQSKQIITTVVNGLNVTNWNQANSISNLAISTIASGIPSELSSSLGVSPLELVGKVYDLGRSPSSTILANYTISLFEAKLSNSSIAGSGFSVSQLLHSAYELGIPSTFSASWELSSSFIANATKNTFANSPLYSVNSSSLQLLLTKLSPNSTLNQIQQAINNMVVNQTLLNYPFVPESPITKNFVSPNNDSMIVIFNFSSQPVDGTILYFNTAVQNSTIQSLGKIYVTGTSVVTRDVQNVFTPALTVTLGPGIAISLLIVGLLFMSPIAALIPIILGGLSIAIAYPAIYLGIVVIGHGQITFLTPTLTTLLMLGLAVDYAVLQLRRTREERRNGRSIEESVGTSLKWAGQAVLTAGITVVVAYIVMAVANVPLFSDVGSAIALGVSILLAMSLTLLPAIELSMGDRLFWPGLRRKHSANGMSRLKHVAEATLKRKFAITAVVSVIALGAFYTTYHTPVGSDFLRLIPNFPSNQGLTAITNSFGSGEIAPTVILVTTPSPITYGDNQFNQTLLNQIELISARAASSQGVVSVEGPTRPFGSSFNYSALGNLSAPIRLQYESGMLSLIGKDNRTALIQVGLSSGSESQEAISTLLQMEKNINTVSLQNGISLYFGGNTQATYDNQSFIVGLLPQVIIILAIAVYVILFLQLRSAFTPLRLIFTILCSVAISLAVLSLTFHTLLSLPILDFAPLFVVVTMLGVGIDYDIFFVTRIREEVLGGKSDTEAIKTAVEKVWVTIFGLGLVLATVFGSLLITGIAILQEISLTVSVAILLDVGAIILFFVPSLMGIVQRFNWWPSRIGRKPKDLQKSSSPNS